MTARSGWLLLAVLLLSTIGDEITLVTLMFRVAGGRDPGVWVPALLFAQLLAGLAAAPQAGRMVDRHDAGTILIFASIGQAIVLVLLSLVGGGIAVVIGSALLGVLFACSGTATFALLPVVAARLGIPVARANAGIEGVRSLGMLAGPVAGGFLVAWGGTGPALLIDAASFLLLAVTAAVAHVRRAGTMAAAAEASLRAEYRPILADRRVMILLAALALGVFATAIADVVFVFLVTVSLRADSVTFGLLTAAWAVGMLAGAAVAGRSAMRWPVAVAFLSIAAMGLTMIAIGASPALMMPSPAFVGGAFLIGGLCNSAHNVAVRTLLQTAIPAALHGRAAALHVSATHGAQIGGYLVGGLFAPGHAYPAYWLAGLLSVAAGLGGLLLVRRRAD